MEHPRPPAERGGIGGDRVKCKFEHDEDCCNIGSPQYMCKCKPSACNSAVPMTNADRIRAMSDEELQKFLNSIYSAGTRDGNMRDGFSWDLEWLRKPARED